MDQYRGKTAYQRLVVDEQPVLLLGEGTFTFSTALAALRGSWDKICATERNTNVPDYYMVTVNQLKHIVEDEENSEEDENGVRYVPCRTLSQIIKLADQPRLWISGIDATKLSDFFFPYSDRENFKRNIYFQCPWAYPGSTAELLRDIVLSSASVQKYGDYLFFGLTKAAQYVPAYDLTALKIYAETHGYHQLEEDTMLVNESLKFGYYHYSPSGYDIHSKLRSHHYTLCFVRFV